MRPDISGSCISETRSTPPRARDGRISKAAVAPNAANRSDAARQALRSLAPSMRAVDLPRGRFSGEALRVPPRLLLHCVKNNRRDPAEIDPSSMAADLPNIRVWGRAARRWF